MLELHGISRATFDLIVASEVTSEAFYVKHYRHPEWPGEQSGVTGGIGYDFGQQSRAQILADWSGKIPDAMVKALAKCAGVTGAAAAPLARGLRDVVDVPWDAALDVFANHDVPRYLGMLFRACPGARELAPDCVGVLLSIVFNRGAGGFNSSAPRYAEMRQIKAAVAAGELARIPGLIRSMKRLWPNSKGLRVRRDDEAALFEHGLAASHPHEHAKLPTTPAPDDPDVVAHVQARLRELGYFEVGQVDGEPTAGGRTEAAILAFRNEHGLPLTTAIDDQLLTELGKAAPRQVAEARAYATVDDLRAGGSQTIALTDRAKRWAGNLFGGSTGLGGAGVLAWFTDRATQLSAAKDAVGGLGLTPAAIEAIAIAVAALVVVAGAGVLVWFVAHELEQRRVADYRAGKHA
ncbi:peptidoglycan-binding protein [Bradyrhizobium lablabi]|uniref:peptidoglycan-binding protein n=1 Tax=Bradyrhizobium lablabi TaxID=722472 RepID=UPI001BAD0181|nr:peptidoglycan-binding protein [Bradyrhizobium lablabi]MBR0695938.1 peptidoglycan-binding protein [Bradyrhizobium lablabi]